MSVSVFNVENKKVDEISMPKVFQTPYRPDIIKKAVITQQSHKFQPQGRDPMSGKRTTAESWGTGRGLARVPRLRGSTRAAFGVSIVGGHQAFPPKSEKRIKKSINKKERRFAVKSGIAATAMRERVSSRGHIIDSILQLPIVVEDEIQSITKSKEIRSFFQNLGVWADVVRANRKKIRAGKGKMRGRKKKTGKGPLIVISEDFGIGKAARNFPGVDVVEINNLNIELLAPGAYAGRLTIWTKRAFISLDKIWGVV